jgi:hypothetical protein
VAANVRFGFYDEFSHAAIIVGDAKREFLRVIRPAGSGSFAQVSSVVATSLFLLALWVQPSGRVRERRGKSVQVSYHFI